MKKLTLSLLLLLFVQTSFAATAQVNNVLNLGGIDSGSNLIIPEPNPSGYFTVYSTTASTTNDFYHFYKDGVAYQVTAGKTAKVVRINVFFPVAGTICQLMSATNNFTDGAVSVTGGVYQSGSTPNYSVPSASSNNAVAGYSSTYSFGASTYPGLQCNANGTNLIWLTLKEI